MIYVPKSGEKIRSKFNGREFVIMLVGKKMMTKLSSIKIYSVSSLRFLVHKSGEKIRSKFNGREFVIMLVGKKMIVLEEMSLAIRFVTTIDNLRSFYEYARS